MVGNFFFLYLFIFILGAFLVCLVDLFGDYFSPHTGVSVCKKKGDENIFRFLIAIHILHLECCSQFCEILSTGGPPFLSLLQILLLQFFK